MRASRVFQNDLWINSFGNVEAVNEFSVQQAQKKYEESLIAEEAEKHKKELQEIGQQHDSETEAIRNEMRMKEGEYQEKSVLFLKIIVSMLENAMRRMS